MVMRARTARRVAWAASVLEYSANLAPPVAARRAQQWPRAASERRLIRPAAVASGPKESGRVWAEEQVSQESRNLSTLGSKA